MSVDFLKTIVTHKKSLLQQKRAFFATLKKKIKDDTFSRYHIFKSAISKPGQMNLIAEIKKASPSKGIICKHFDPVRIATVYAKSGAGALSILTEEKYFLGKVPYMRKVSEQVNLPILAKDFFIDEVQIYEAFYFGASAVLLIAAILKDDEIKHLMSVASRLDLDCLVEVHNEKELNRALKADADIIGINNRDLHTFAVDIQTSEKLIPKIPKDKVVVAESGLKTHAEIQLLAELGAHAVLIGETFLQSSDTAGKIKEVMHGV